MPAALIGDISGEALVGGMITISLVTTADTPPIQSFETGVLFDETKLRWVSIGFGPEFPFSSPQPLRGDSVADALISGQTLLGGTLFTRPSGAITLASLTFEILAPGELNVDFVGTERGFLQGVGGTIFNMPVVAIFDVRPGDGSGSSVDLTPLLDGDDPEIPDQLRGSDASEVFVMTDDGVRDLVRGFDPESDKIDVSAFAASLDDLTISEQTRRDGSISWINISDRTGEAELALRFSGAPLAKEALTTDQFIFAAGPLPPVEPNLVMDIDAAVANRLSGTFVSDIFVMTDDGVHDLVRGFDPDSDKIDVSAFAASLDDLTVTEQTRRDGSISWINISDRTGEAELALRFEGAPLAKEALTPDQFIFAAEPLPPVEPNLVMDIAAAGANRLSGTFAPDVFVMTDDGVRDLVRGFDPEFDKIDVSAFASSLDDLTVTEQTRRDGSISWINISDRTGEAELALRFALPFETSADALTVDVFIFG